MSVNNKKLCLFLYIRWEWDGDGIWVRLRAYMSRVGGVKVYNETRVSMQYPLSITVSAMIA